MLELCRYIKDMMVIMILHSPFFISSTKRLFLFVGIRIKLRWTGREKYNHLNYDIPIIRGRGYL